jgi:hypothetical protein
MSVSVNCFYPGKHQHQPTLAHEKTMQEDDEVSLTESNLSEDEKDEHVPRKVLSDEGDDHVSRLNNSMSVFMSSLAGLHSGDLSFCLQMDNAKPRDLPPSTPSPSVELGSDASSVVSSTRKNNGLSRWESTPTSNRKMQKGNKSGPITPVTQATRSRAMRPWRHPANNLSNSTGLSSNSDSTRKSDAPMARPQRVDSNRTLKSNAKLPQRADSIRSLKPELSIRDIRESAKPADSSHSGHASQMASRYDYSMDLRVLLECEEDNLDEAAANFRDEGDGDGTGGVFLKIPAMQSQHSLWGSASTMTASYRTMASSHYSSSHNSNYNASSSLESSKRSLFCKSEVERPLSPPRRTRSREGFHTGFSSTACEQPVRRPVRHPSDRSMLSGSATLVTPTAPGEAAVTVSDCLRLLPALSLHDSSYNFSFKLIRSLSEQTLETDAMFQNRQVDANNNSNATSKDGRFLKRTLSESSFFMSQELNLSEHAKAKI